MLVTWVLLGALYVVLVFKTQFEEYVAGVICGLVSVVGVDLVRTHRSVALHQGSAGCRGLHGCRAKR